jgi:hypothetical protein
MILVPFLFTVPTKEMLPARLPHAAEDGRWGARGEMPRLATGIRLGEIARGTGENPSESVAACRMSNDDTHRHGEHPLSLLLLLVLSTVLLLLAMPRMYTFSSPALGAAAQNSSPSRQAATGPQATIGASIIKDASPGCFPPEDPGDPGLPLLWSTNVHTVQGQITTPTRGVPRQPWQECGGRCSSLGSSRRVPPSLPLP